MSDPVRVELPVPDAPSGSDGAAGSPPGTPAGQRLRAIDTLLADRGQLFQALFLSAPIAKALVDLDGEGVPLLRGVADGNGPRMLLLDAHAVDAPESTPTRAAPRDLGYVIYTSGSTASSDARCRTSDVPRRRRW